jgi:NTE family protein
VAFVLSGGASLGAIQAGMVKALYERGVAPDLIVGASVGALNGAFIASRPATAATADELADVWLGLERSEVFPLNPVMGFVGFFGRRNYLVPDGPLRRVVRRNLSLERLEDARVPLHVIATDVMTGTEVRLSHGDALEAVMASAAIPGVFPPVEWGDRELIDGGVANNAPITHALELGAEEVYVLSTGYACALDEPPAARLRCCCTPPACSCNAA